MESYKKSAEAKLYGARDSASSTYDEAKFKAEKGAKEAESSGSSWFGWGKTKAQEAKYDAKKQSDKVADVAGEEASKI